MPEDEEADLRDLVVVSVLVKVVDAGIGGAPGIEEEDATAPPPATPATRLRGGDGRV